MNWYKMSSKPKIEKLWGTLMKNDNYYYLKIDNRIMTPFMQMIDSEKAINPDDIQEEDKKIGSHITVIKNDEGENIKKVKELGKEFPFTIKGFESVKPDGWEEVKKVYMITVESPELEKLRKKYNLSAKIEDHDFHISVAVEKS